MKLHIVVHESFEGPVAIEQWAKTNYHQLSYSRTYLGEALPKSVDEFDFLIIMGGPQSPATTIEECPHFNAAAEIALIQNAARNNKIVLGVCLGAQLIGEAFGAKTERSPYKEIGNFEISLTEAAKQDPIFANFPKSFLVGHWHGDMPGLSKDAKVLASSRGCPRQIINYAPKVYGFQCHFEFTTEAVEQLIANCQADIENNLASPYVQLVAELRKNNYHSMNKLLFKFLDTIVLLSS